MKPILTCAEMRTLEKQIIASGVPGRVLMENAASAAQRRVLAHHPSRVLVFCGKGNNGGDGYALARRLYAGGMSVEIITATDAPLSGDAAENRHACEVFGVKITDFSDFIRREAPFRDALCVDALLGTGLSGNVRPDMQRVIASINESGAPVLSLDIPSGIDGDSGKVLGIAVRADETVTFGAGKAGLYSPLSAAFTGRIYVDDISIPTPSSACRLIEKQDIRLRPLLPADHKGVNGRVLIAGGQAGMAGAVYMAVCAAEAAGAGLVTAAVPDKLLPVMMRRLVGAMCASADDAAVFSQKTDALLVGCGMGRTQDAAMRFKAALRTDAKTVVMDADGLFHLAENLSVLREIPGRVILTPHIGEMARLSGKTAEYVTENRIPLARSFASEYGVTLVLKGAYTVVAFPDGQTYINTTGNAGMAKGGSGDILAGLITGLAAAGTENPAVCGVYLHGLAGDRASRFIGMRSMSARHLLNFLPSVIRCMKL